MHPGDVIPDLALQKIGGGSWQLPADCHTDFTLLVVYRGLHCSVCSRYLAELTDHMPALVELGVTVIATSADTEEKASKAWREWTGERVPMGYGLDEDVGRALGLFLSSARKAVEPDRFFEPGLYLVKKDGGLLFVSLQNMPFGRTPIQDLVEWIPKIVANGIPPRGTQRY
ncbi:MAG: redoxin domain-containing protein [Halieaceae bacterium]|nr:redoxin domain-containing protein [Halieaceae bacterium]